jgi:hypothetical protein
MRAALLLIAMAAAQAQQTPDALAPLRQAAEKTSADWEAKAKGLDQKIARLLPCDPAGRAAVEEVSRASAARLAALSAYVKAEALSARDDVDAVKRVLSEQAALGGAWAAERAESDQDHTALEARIAELKESMRKRSALSGAEQALMELSRMAKDRTAKADEQSSRKDAVNALLAELLASYQQRQTALEAEASQVNQETARWANYYGARVARAATECAIIAGPRRRQP